MSASFVLPAIASGPLSTHLAARGVLGALGQGVVVVILVIFLLGLLLGLVVGFLVGRLVRRPVRLREPR